MKYKFNIGDRVRVLNGQDIPDYTGGWNSEMNRYINLNGIVTRQLDDYNPYPSYMIQLTDYIADLYYPSNTFV